ncbi:MAG: S66 peptidase family protein [Ornithinimicrobium sp.]
MTIRYPAPMHHGDRVGVTAVSAGVPAELMARFDVAVAAIEDRGYEVVMGECLQPRDPDRAHVSAPVGERAAELMSMLLDPTIRAVVPPWGGETAIDVLSLVDWEKLRTADPTWVVGYSDIATLITPLTLSTAVATIHGNNLMDTPYRPADGLVSWLDIVAMPAGTTFAQFPPGRYRRSAHVDFASQPAASELTLDAPGAWRRLDEPGDLHVGGRLIGGCIETISPLIGGVLGDVPRFAADHAREGTLVYLEAAESSAFSICRALHGMRLAGFFDSANAILVGRTSAPDDSTMTQDEAVLDALGSLDVPIIADVDCGHVAPFMPLVNGAHAEVRMRGDAAELIQTLA